LGTDRAAEQPRKEPSTPKSATVPSENPAHATNTDVEEPTRQELETQGPSSTEQADDSVQTTPQTGEPCTTQPNEDQTTESRSRKRRILPWLAVNQPRVFTGEDDEEEPAAAPAKKTRKPPKPRKKKTPATVDPEDVEQPDEDQDTEAQPVRKRPSAKARGKWKADAVDAVDDPDAPTPAKRTRKPRKARGHEGAGDVDAEEVEAEEQEGTGEETVVRRKPSKPRQPKRRRAAVEGEEGGEEDAAQPKRKGRPPRADTPSDAEDNEINPEHTYMESLASRNIRVGRLSQREKAMREIDWDAVRLRQKEDDTKKMETAETLAAAERLARENPPPELADSGPRFHEVNGAIVMIPNSGTIDAEAQADLGMQNFVVVEEASLTTRITTRSFMKKNKRFPNEFLLPGQGMRWTHDDTERFYEGLRMFGTDFQMISRMFPGVPRRSIKTKFTREEREDPEAVRTALLSRSEVNTNWDSFLTASKMQEENFVDTDRVKREMAEHEASMRLKINEAKKAKEERDQQRKDAGFLDDEGNEINKENGKGKKKRKGKQVSFEDEPGVEIIVDDDPDWGRE
jgi:transcription factor TFIIIB component B''